MQYEKCPPLRAHYEPALRACTANLNDMDIPTTDRNFEQFLSGGRSARPVSEAIQEFLNRTGLVSRMKHREIYAVWERLAGEVRAKHTRVVSMRGGVLEIEVGSAPLMHELEFEKHTFLKALQAEIRKPFIHRIIFRLGRIEQE